MIVQVFVAQRYSVDPLFDQRLHGMLDQVGVTVVSETIRQALEDAGTQLHFPQQQAATVGTDETAIKLGADGTALQAVKGERFKVYTVFSRGCPFMGR